MDPGWILSSLIFSSTADDAICTVISVTPTDICLVNSVSLPPCLSLKPCPLFIWSLICMRVVWSRLSLLFQFQNTPWSSPWSLLFICHIYYAASILHTTFSKQTIYLMVHLCGLCSLLQAFLPPVISCFICHLIIAFTSTPCPTLVESVGPTSTVLPTRSASELSWLLGFSSFPSASFGSVVLSLLDWCAVLS